MLGLTPKLNWKRNPDSAVRSVREAIEIAEASGVDVLECAAFFVDEQQCLDKHATARGPKVTKATGDVVVWDDLLNRFGQVPFLVRPDILESDEAIVAVFAHEMHELRGLMPLLHQGHLTIEQFAAHTSPTNPGNLHDEAWDVADELVEQMRRKKNDL